ncbi:hypothetical protein HDV04_002536, partial [Boothiomyces sp. JEL0838]
MKFKDTSIIALDKQVNIEPSLVPKKPFTLSLVASKGGGKSSLMLNMLLNPHILNKKFNKLIVVSPTRKLDSKWKLIEEHDITVINKPLIREMNKKKKKTIFGDYYNDYDSHNRIEYYDEPDLEYLEQVIKDQEHM